MLPHISPRLGPSVALMPLAFGSCMAGGLFLLSFGFALGKPVNPPKVGLLSRSDWTRGDTGLCGGPFLDTAIDYFTDYGGQPIEDPQHPPTICTAYCLLDMPRNVRKYAAQRTPRIHTDVSAHQNVRVYATYSSERIHTDAGKQHKRWRHD